jgi:hypothetical protein
MVCVVLGLYTPSWCWYRRPEIGSSSIDWTQLSRFYLKTETESSIRNTVFWNINRIVFTDKDRMMNICNISVYLWNSTSYLVDHISYIWWILMKRFPIMIFSHVRNLNDLDPKFSIKCRIITSCLRGCTNMKWLPKYEAPLSWTLSSILLPKLIFNQGRMWIHH